MKYDRRYIEETFPVKEVSRESGQEKNIRRGHISAMHIWWARKPLTASRAIAYASLIDYSNIEIEKEKKNEFIVELAKWESAFNRRIIGQARRDISQSFKELKPRVLDPFGGGGAIPLEAMRLGCETYSSDLNPVAVIIQKCTLEYPQKFGPNIDYDNESETIRSDTNNDLLDEFIKWSDWLRKTALDEIGEYFLENDSRNKTIGYIWARTIPCQNPSCNFEIPLIHQYWLAKKDGKKVSLYPIVKESGIDFKIVGDGYEKMPSSFNPAIGSVSRAVVTCLSCGSTIDGNTTRKLFKTKLTGERIIAAAYYDTEKKEKMYRIVNKEDLERYDQAKKALNKLVKEVQSRKEFDPLPTEPTPEGKGSGAERAFSLRNYGIDRWIDLFNSRQLLILLTLTVTARKAHAEMLKQNYNPDFAKAIVTYLGLLISRCSDFESTYVRWFNHVENACNTFARPILSISWAYFELNPFSLISQGTLKSMSNQIRRALEGIVNVGRNPAKVIQASATSLPYPDDYFDVVFTDPPYYDNVPYSYLSDFFYVWLKRSIGDLYPNLFSTPQTPKSKEIVAYSHHPGGFEEGKQFFEENLSKSFKEIKRVLKNNGISIIVYAHKSTEGWETLVNSLLDSGLIITSSWPLNTEMTGRLRAKESAALASSIYIIARKMKREPTAIYRDVKQELKQHLKNKLQSFWKEGIGGADFFIAAIGSAIEVFGKYELVIDYEGNTIRANTLLDDVRQLATNFAIQQILQNGFSEDISPLTRFYLLYRWNFGSVKVEFDEARKLAQSCGIDLTNQWGENKFIRKQKEFIKVVGPEERKIEDVRDSTLLIDVLHYVVLLWNKGQKDKITSILSEKKLENSEIFWRIAQAIAETLPTQNKEKKLLDGFLAGRNSYIDSERHEQVTFAVKPTKLISKKKGKTQKAKKDSQDKYEQVELE